MRLSCFNHYAPGYPEPGSTLVHNTLSGGFVVVDDETLAALRRADAGDELGEADAALVRDPDLWDSDVGVMVESREAEEAEFLAWFEKRRSRKQQLEALVSINLACNFECTYCSQDGILDGTVMKTEVVDRTADWLAERALSAGVGGIHLAFCGGEPLLHPDRIARMASRIRDRIAPAGLGLTFMAITNGYFLTGAVLDLLVPLGLVEVQVTIDGDQSTHSLTRVSKKGEDTFARVFGNAMDASKRIGVYVNGNYTPETSKGFMPLVGQLADAGLPAGSHVRFTPAMEGLSSPDWAGGGGMCTWSEADTSLHVAMQDEILRRGFHANPINVVGPCEFHDHHSFAIDPEGIIYKCPGFLGHPEWGIGHVTTGLQQDRYDHLLRATPQTSCTGCGHRPNCGGGCLASEWLKSGVAEGVNCDKPYFERVAEEAVVRQFLIATHERMSEAVAAFPPPRQLQTVPARQRRSAALRVLA
ncbi:MAG TPA: radical SAM protein [Kofleriaceae bacterium]|nr:radical SAM protein [Kofleriaceae bacterium]